MSDSANPNTPAGWYPDPAGSGKDRWWDGSAWTEQLAARPVVPSMLAQAAPQTPHQGQYVPSTQHGQHWQPAAPTSQDSNTPWIWLIVLLPVVAIIPIFFWDFRGYLLDTMTNPRGAMMSTFSPAYIAMIVVSWVCYGASVWFAYRDYATLGQRGHQRRFHWAWTFLSSLVYIIGRSVMVRRAVGRGLAPMWVSIALSVASTIFVIGWMLATIVPAVRDISGRY